jgi:hypothetical protein
LTLSNVQANDAGTYSVVVSNLAGFVISSNATFQVETVILPPVLTNFTWLPAGSAQCQLIVESNQFYSVESSYDLMRWSFAFAFQASSNLMTFIGGPDLDRRFLRARVGWPIYYHTPFFTFYASGGAFAGSPTPLVTFPVRLQQYDVTFQLDNAPTNGPATSDVWFTGPGGSGFTNTPAAASWPAPAHYGRAVYLSPRVFSPVSPPPGQWTVRYGQTNLSFTAPDPQTTNRFFVPVPTVTVSNDVLQSLSFVLKDPAAGTNLAAKPGWLGQMYIDLYGLAGMIYRSPSFSPRQSNYPFPTNIQWSKVTSVGLSYADGEMGNIYYVTYQRP